MLLCAVSSSIPVFVQKQEDSGIKAITPTSSRPELSASNCLVHGELIQEATVYCSFAYEL